MSKPSNTNNPNSSLEKLYCMSGCQRNKNRREIRDIFGGYRAGEHLLPFRTEKLSPASPMILLHQVGKQEAARLDREPCESEALFFMSKWVYKRLQTLLLRRWSLAHVHGMGKRKSFSACEQVSDDTFPASYLTKEFYHTLRKISYALFFMAESLL